MAGISNRDPNVEDANEALVAQNKREIDRGESKPGIHRGSSPREKEERHDDTPPDDERTTVRRP